MLLAPAVAGDIVFRGIVKNVMKISILTLLIATVVTSSLSSCLPLVAGAAAGYVAHDQGYRVRNPFTKSGN